MALGREVVATEGRVSVYESGAVTSTQKWGLLNGCTTVVSDVNTSTWKKSGENERFVVMGDDELTTLKKLSQGIKSELVPESAYNDFQTNGRIFEYKIENGLFVFVNPSWNLNNKGNGIFDFVIREDGELMIGEYHTFLLGKGQKDIFLEQKTFKGAGKITIFNGKIEHVTSDTGHLQTSKQGCINQYWILRKAGLSTEDCTIDHSFSQK